MEKDEIFESEQSDVSVDETKNDDVLSEEKDVSDASSPVASPAKKRKFFGKKLSVKVICYCALLVALSVIANTFTVYFNFAGSNALSFTYTVCFLAGAFFGPFAGFLVGACGDLIGWLINPSGGAFNPLIVFTSGLLGLIPGIVFMIVKKFFGKSKNYDRMLPIWTLVAFVFMWLICTNLNTVIVFYMYISGVSKKYTALGAYYIYRTPFQTLFWAINLALSLALVVPLKKLIKV